MVLRVYNNKNSKVLALVFFALFLLIKYYFCSFEDMKDSILTAALIYDLI